MRHHAAVFLLLAATSTAQAQCPLGSYPTTNGDAEVVCQSAGGQAPPVTQVRPITCPPGATQGTDSYGRRTCSTLKRDGDRLDRPVDGPVQDRVVR